MKHFGSLGVPWRGEVRGEFLGCLGRNYTNTTASNTRKLSDRIGSSPSDSSQQCSVKSTVVRCEKCDETTTIDDEVTR